MKKPPLSRTMIATLLTLVLPKSLYLTKTDLGNFVILFLFRLQKLSFSRKSVSFSFCSLYLFQNCLFTTLFQQSKQSRTIDLNTTHLILFKSPRDIQQIDYLGRQLNNAKFLRHAYQLATKEDFGHLLIDLDPKTSECFRYSSNIVPPSPTIFYLPSSKAVITSLENERERIMYIEANAQ